MKNGEGTVPARAEMLYIIDISLSFSDLLEGTRNVILVFPLYQAPDRLVERLNVSKLASKLESKIISGRDRVSSSLPFEARVLFFTIISARLKVVKVFFTTREGKVRNGPIVDCRGDGIG